MKTRTISVVALLVVLCTASFVLWNFTRVAAKSVNNMDDGNTSTIQLAGSSSSQDSTTEVIRAEIPASGTIELCEAVLPGNTIEDAEIRQRGPQSLHWINELYQGDEGHLFLKYDYRETFGHDTAAFAYLKRFVAALESQNIQLVTLVLPPRTMIYSESLVSSSRPYNLDLGYQNFVAALQTVRDIGIIAPDLATPFLELAKTDAVYFKRDHHWTPEAARVAAKAVAEAVQDNAIYQGLSKQEFSTTQDGLAPLDDATYMLRVEAVCGVEIEDEPFNAYVTEQAEESSGAGLFGDAPKIPVVLAGTSHSAIEKFNFAGFLQEELSTDVLNVAKSSGGQFAGLMQYLPDEELRATVDEPSLLVWEREFQGSFVQPFINDLRQLIPSVHGTCSVEEAVASRTVEAEGGKRLDLGLPSGIAGSNHYLVADIADLSIKNPSVYLKYSSGAEERLPLGNPRVRPKHFFMELLGADAGELNQLSVEFPKDVFGTITLKICKANL